MNAKLVGIIGLLVGLWILEAIMIPESFLTGNNVENLLRRTAMYGILGIGVSFVIITGGIDLSIGSLVCLTGILSTMFLNVTYEPWDQVEIVRAEASTQSVLIPAGESSGFRAGDRIRYFGGTRARSVVGRVTEVESAGTLDEAETQPTTRLTLDTAISSDDRRGSVAKVYAVLNVNAPQQSITIEGKHPQLARRDKLTLVHETKGIQEFVVEQVELGSDRSQVQVRQSFSADLANGWIAVPVERSPTMAIPLALLAVVLVALVLGATHGVLVTKIQLPPFVVTLCGLLVYRGISRWLVDDQTPGFGNEYDHNLMPLAKGKLALGAEEVFGIPYPFLLMLVVALVAAFFLNWTIWGRYMLALGRNEAAARFSGIRTERMTILAYMICSVCAAVGGILFALDGNSVSPSSSGNLYELHAIAAAVLGGCSLRGGEGGIFGVIVGTALMQTLNNLIVLFRVSDTLEYAIIGAVILLGVIGDEAFKRITARRRMQANKLDA